MFTKATPQVLTMFTGMNIAAAAKRLGCLAVVARWRSVVVLTLLVMSALLVISVGSGSAQDITPAQPGRYAAPYDQSRGVHS